MPEIPELLTLTDTSKTEAIADKKAAEEVKALAVAKAKALEEKRIAKVKAVAGKNMTKPSKLPKINLLSSTPNISELPRSTNIYQRLL